MSDIQDKVVSTASYAGATVSVVSGLTLTEWGIIIGIATALATFAANMIYQHRKDKRDQRLYEAEMSRLESEK
jgi:uncharacterized membrane protein (DUF485 family)